MIFICLKPQYKIVICRDAYRTFNFMLLTGSCVDMPRHGSAQSWVIRMPGLMTMRGSKRLSSSGRGEPFSPAPRRPAGDNRAFKFGVARKSLDIR